MKENESTELEDYLSVLVNTRLFYNTIAEYEEVLGTYSIHNNGIRRCFNTPQKLCTAFRHFQVEALTVFKQQTTLDEILIDYKTAWSFYAKHLSRRRNPELLASHLLSFYYPPYSTNNLSKVELSLFDSIVHNHINVPMIFLMLLKALPGYESKEGNVLLFNRIYDDTISKLTQFTNTSKLFSVSPSIIQANEERHKTRISLIYHVGNILDTYTAYSSSNNLYIQSSLMKDSSIDIQLDGFWNEYSGELNSTIFWEIQHAVNDGTYFVTRWHKNDQNILTGTRYTMFIYETTDAKMIAYVLHPTAIRTRIKGSPYSDADNTWYVIDVANTEEPGHVIFNRLMNSNFWPQTFDITKVADRHISDTYDRWLNTCEIRMLYKELEYLFIPNLYASTKRYLYIPIEKTNKYYQVPRSAELGLDNVRLGDLAGIMQMNGKQYIVFDELLLYIEITPQQLEKYNIKIVDNIV